MSFFEELFSRQHEHSHKRGHYDRESSHRGDRISNHHREWNDDRERHRHDGFGFADSNSLIRRLLTNKTALVLLALAAIVVLVVVVTAFVYVLPLATKTLGIVDENGMKSIVDQALLFMNKIWFGSGK